MKKVYLLFPVLLFIAVLVYACKKNSDAGTVEQTSTSGELTLYVDSTVEPIAEDVIAVFESVYDRATVKQVNKTEGEIINALLSDSADVAILSRQLTKEESQYFKNKNIEPKITEFATDAIALITNKKEPDSIIDIQEIFKVIRGEASKNVNKLVFDNPNSSTVQLLLQMAGTKTIPAKNVYSLKTNEEVIKYVHDNSGTVGIIGVNWLVQPPAQLKKYTDDIKVLAVNNVKADSIGNSYYKPSQSNIAAGLYPLTRKLYVLNYQGKDALGTGFAIYISADSGQRIILKSGLVPVTFPTRDIIIRNEL